MNEIDGALKKFKQFEISEEQAKIQEYKLAYEIIHENYPLTLAKNFASKVSRLLLFLISIAFFTLTVYAFIPKGFQNHFSDLTNAELLSVLSAFLGFSFLLIAICAYFLRISMKKNQERRNVIYELSGLLEDVIEHTEQSLEEKTRRYEMYVENLHRNQR